MHHNLFSYAERKNLVDPGFADRQVSHQIVIDLKGKWISGQRVTSGTEPYVTLRAPMQSGRTSGSTVSAVVESGACYFGLKTDAKATTPARAAKVARRGLELQHVYREHTRQMATDTRDPYAEALSKFVDALAEGTYGTPSEAAVKCLGWSDGKPLTGSEWITVVVRANNELTPVYESPRVKEWIRAHRPIQSGGAGGELITCIVTGRRGPLCNTQPQIKGLPGAKGGSSALSSFNKPAWCSSWRSFELIQGANAPVIQDVAEGMSAAANFLLERVAIPFKRTDGTIGVRYKPRGGVYLNSSGKPQPGDAVFLIWTGDPHTELPVRGAVTALIAGPSTEPTETFLRIEDADEASVRSLLSVEADEKIVEELIAVHRTGRTMPLFREDYFHSLLISDNGRVVYRNAVSGTIGDLRRRIQQYSDDMHLPIPSNNRPRPLSQLLAALRTRMDERFPSSTVDGMLHCILQGERVPVEIADAALRRCNTYPGDNDGRKQWRRLLPVRCSLLKLDLIRKGIPVTIHADPLKSQNLIVMPIPMVIGCIMAEANYVQNIAINHPQHSSLSRTEIVQSPYNVLPDVLTLHTKHIKKLNSKRRGGMAMLSQKRMNALVTRLGVEGPLTETDEAALSLAQIPQRLTKEQQMLFWIGFNNYTGWLWEEYRKRTAARARAEEVEVPNQSLSDGEDQDEEGNDD
jgi:CRISPR-associated protein Csd1